VAVDESGYDSAAARVYDIARDVLARDVASLPDGDDASAFDRDCAVLNHASRRVHRHDHPAADYQVNALQALRPGGVGVD
jgi:hypothetical protein